MFSLFRKQPKPHELASLCSLLKSATGDENTKDAWRTVSAAPTKRSVYDAKDTIGLTFKDEQGKNVAAPQFPYFCLEAPTSTSSPYERGASAIAKDLNGNRIPYITCNLMDGRSRIIVTAKTMQNYRQRLEQVAQERGLPTSAFDTSSPPTESPTSGHSGVSVEDMEYEEFARAAGGEAETPATAANAAIAKAKSNEPAIERYFPPIPGTKVSSPTRESSPAAEVPQTGRQ